MSKDVIVFDEELKNADTQIVAYSEVLIKRMEKYVEIMKMILQTAVLDTEISKELYEIVGEVETIGAELSNIKNNIKGECSNYVSAIDNVDKFIY